MIAKVDQPQLPTCADVLRQQDIGGPGSLVSMLIEVQPDGSQLLLKGDDRVYQEMIKRHEACEAEEIIIGNQRATYEGTDEGTHRRCHSPYGRWFVQDIVYRGSL